jgi:hypothetical protein
MVNATGSTPRSMPEARRAPAVDGEHVAAIATSMYWPKPVSRRL